MAIEPTAERRDAQHGPPPERLLTAGLVALLYSELLGRPPRPDETASQLAATDDWGVLLHAILASDEFATSARKLVAKGARHMNLWLPELARHALAPGTLSTDEDVLVGEDGWLFLVGGTNAVFDQYSPGARLHEETLGRWHDAVEWRMSWCASRSIATASIIVPDKFSRLSRFLPPGHAALGEGLAMQLVRENPTISFPFELLEGAENFLRTDSHLSLEGATRVANVVLEELGCAPALAPEATEYLLPGDLGSRFRPAILEVADIARSLGTARIIADNSATQADLGLHVGTLTVLENDSAPDSRTVVIFGDSYSRIKPTYQGLAWFAAQQFRTVHFVWDPFGFDPEYVERVGADIVVFEMAERFVIRPPSTPT